jgi:hypothetical protein
MVSVGAQRAANTPTPRQIDSQAPDAGPHGFTTDAGRIPSVPPGRQRPLGHREILAWTVAALTGAVIAATITITGIATSATDGNTPAAGARAVAVAPLPASPTSGLGSREPPEPSTAATAIPLAALPKADPPKASSPRPTPVAGTRSKITATTTTTKAKATAAAKKKSASHTSTTTPHTAKASVSGKVKKSAE